MLGPVWWLREVYASRFGDALRLLNEIRFEEVWRGLAAEEEVRFFAARGDGVARWHAEVSIPWQGPMWTDPIFKMVLRFHLWFRVLPATNVGELERTCVCGTVHVFSHNVNIVGILLSFL